MRRRSVAGVAAFLVAILVSLAPLASPAVASDISASLQLLPRDDESGLTLEVIGNLAPGALGLPGEQITWVISLKNSAPAPFMDAIVTAEVREELRIDSVEVQRGDFAISGQMVVFTTPLVQPGEQVRMRVNATVLRTPPGGTLGNRARLTARGPRGAVEADVLTEVYVPTGLPATGYPPDENLPGSQPSVPLVALVAVTVVALAAGYVRWRGGAPHLG